MNLTGTKTEQNLLAAFAGESMAANKYDFFAEVASQEGYEQYKAIFQETARKTDFSIFERHWHNRRQSQNGSNRRT